MSTIKRKVEVAARAAMLAVFMISSLVPASVGARPSSAGSPAEAGSETGEGLPEAPAAVYAPTIQTPQLDTDPQGDEVPSRVPKKEAVGLFVTAAPAGEGVFKIGVTIRNNTEKPVTGLRFEDALENGFEYSQNPASAVTYDGGAKKVALEIEQVSAGEVYAFDYFIKINTSKRSEIRGKAWIRNISLTGDDQLKVSAQMTVGVDVAAGNASVIALEAGEWNQVGNLKIYMDAEAVGGDGVLVVEPLAKGIDKGPKMQFELKAYKSSAKISRKSNGEANEQAVGLGKEHSGNFASPAFLEIDVNGYFDLKKIPAGQEPYVATYDEKLKIWVKVPILEQDAEANTVVVEAAHFSTWGTGLGESLPQNGANVLLFDQPYTSLFTGSARYSIPIWTPPGRAGMAPEIALSYSSATVDGVLGDVQAPWVGVGWNIDSAEIVRKITTDEDGYGYVNEFALTINGAMYELYTDDVSGDHSRYYTDQDAFLYIERHNYMNGNATSDGVVPPNATGEWWEVVTTDGTRYRLGWNEDAEQLALMYGYKCTTEGTNCSTPDGAYALLGYAGLANDRVALRWRVDRVMDTHGNYIEYRYKETQPSGATRLAPFDRESYLDTVSYTGFDDPVNSSHDLSPAYHIKFTYADRSAVGDVPTTFNVWDNVDSKLLDKVEVCHLDCSGTGIVRAYDFGYSLAAVPNTNGTLTLTSMDITGRNGAVITKAPTVRFTYKNLDNRAVSGADEFPYPRLVMVDNGAGGVLNYTYETDGRGTDSWYNYRIKQVRVESSYDTAALQSYTYDTPVYTSGTTNLGGLIGYKAVTENHLDYENGDAIILSTVHSFGTAGLDKGRELKTEWSSGSTVHRRVINTYVSDNSGAPFLGWNFRYLYGTAQYELSGSSLVLTAKSVNTRDPGTGNLLSQVDYLGSSLYRKSYYEYWTGGLSRHITDKVSRTYLVDASNNAYGDTRVAYNEVGDAISTTSLTNDPNNAVTSGAAYDRYGNLEYTYEPVYGSSPSSTVLSSTVYDNDNHTHPLSVTDALGNTSSTEYIYALGLPSSTTDANGWTTSTTYDGLGRTLSVNAPGLNQPGVYYAYPEVNASGRLTAPYAVEMQMLDTTAELYRSVWGLYDGLGRMIQTQVYDADQGKTLVTDNYYNAQGLVDQQSLPYYVASYGGYYLNPSGSQFTQSTFDAQGRAVKTTQPGGIETNTAYDGLTVTVTDPNGHRVSHTSDGLGRMVNVREFSGGTTVYASTAYTYDVSNRLIGVVDAKGNETTIHYDWLGRKTGMDDPDMGEWTYEYNARGNLTKQTDARGEVVNFGYDLLGRATSKTGTGLITSYTYGTTAGTIGMRISMTDSSGTTAWSYDNYGRTVTENRGIGGQTQTLITSSDWLGRPMTVTYPDNEVLTYSYDALGRPIGMDSSESISLVDVAYNTLGQIASQTLGNGVLVTNAYNTANRLQNRSAEKGQEQILAFDYAYDNAGNITQITDSVLGETHNYQYDFLNRLVAGQAVDSSNSDIFKYSQRFSYDQVGNITQSTNFMTPTPLAFRAPDSESAYAPFVFKVNDAGYSAPHFAALAQQEAWTNTPAAATPTPWSGMDQYTSALLHMDGQDASTTFTDQSGKTWTAMGDAQVDRAQSKYGGASALFDGTGDYIETPDSEDFNVGSGDFTVDFWFRKNANGTNMAAFGQMDSSATTTTRSLIGFMGLTTNVISVRAYQGSTAYVLDGTTAVTDTNWHHYAAVRDGYTLTLYLDGVSQGTLDVSALKVNNSSNNFVLGRYGEYASNYSNGWIDEFRFSKGIARWASDFTPPSFYGEGPTLTPTTAPTGTPENWSGTDGYTSSLLHLDGTDASTVITDQTGKTWTVGGNGEIDTAQLKFGSGSGAFDGTGDYLTTVDSEDFNVGSGDFTVDFWFRKNANGTSQAAFAQMDASGTLTTRGLYGYMGLTTNVISIRFNDGSTTYTLDGTTPVTDTNWHHYAAVRKGNTLRLFLDGVSEGVMNVTGLEVNNSSNKFSLGRLGEYAANYANGWIDEFRFSKGIARWEGDFTPPALPYGNSATLTPTPAPTETPGSWSGVDGNTQSLLHMDGADGSTTFIDGTSKIWTAGGNAQVDTDEAVLGAGSVFLDGTGDYLTTADSEDFNVGSGDFTIDFWFKKNLNGTGMVAFGQANSSLTATSIGVYGYTGLASNVISIRFYVGSTPYFVDGTTPVTDTNWHHYAAVRDGDTLRLYLDGNLEGSKNVAGLVVNNSTANFSVGRIGQYAAYYANGWIDEFRFSKGIARWVTEFTPPAHPYGGAPTATATWNPNTVTPTSSITRTPSKTITPSVTRTPTPELGNLMGYWNFDGVTGTTVPDAAYGDVIADNATLYNGAVIETTGVQGQSIYFNGTTQYGAVADSTENRTNGSFTISAWINPAAVVTDRTQYIVHKGGVTYKDYGLITSPGRERPRPRPARSIVTPMEALPSRWAICRPACSLGRSCR